MAWSRDTRKPTRYMRGARRYNDVGGHSPPGDELENTRDHERIWFELRRTRSCCDCEDPGFKYCFQTFDYPSYICGGDFTGGDTMFGYWPGVRVVIGLNDGIEGGCGGSDLGNSSLGALGAHDNGSWRNGPYVDVGGNQLDMSSVGVSWLSFFPNFDRTLEAWIKPTATDLSAGNKLIAHGLAGESLSQGGLDVYFRSNGAVALEHIQVAGGAMQESGAGWWEADQWHHFVLVRNTVARTVAIFINGRLAISRVIPTSGWGVDSFPSGPTMVLEHGAWADVAYYTSALSPTIIRRHYQAVYGVEGAANPLASVEGDPTQVEDPTQVITEQISVDLIDGGGDAQVGSVAISQGEYTAWVTPEDSPFELEERKSQPDGYASLDSGGHVPSAELAPASGADFAFLREDQVWVPGRLPATPTVLEQRLLSWYEAADGYLAALPSYFSRIWLLDGDAVPFPDSGSAGQPFTSGTFTVEEFGAFGGISCPVFSGGTDGLQTASVAAASEQFAFALWVRVDALPASPVNLLKSTDDVFGLRLNTDGTIESWAGVDVISTSVSTVTVGQWCHIFCEHDAVGSTKVSRIGVDGVLNSGTTRFGNGNGNGYTLAGDGFEGAISVVAASSAETQGTPTNAALLSLATDYRSLDWSAYAQSAAVGGVDASEDDTPVTAAPRSRINFKAGTNITVGVVDDSGDDEVEVTITATAPAGSGIEVSDNDADVSASPRGRLNFLDGTGTTVVTADDGANDEVEIQVDVDHPLPDPSGETDGDVLTIASGAWVVATPSGGGGGGGDSYAVEPASEPPAVAHANDDEFSGASLDAKWSWDNQGSATVTLDRGTIILYAPSNGGSHNWRTIWQAAPSGDFTLIVKVAGGTRPVNSHYTGLVVADSASGKRYCWGPVQFSGQPAKQRLDKWNSKTSFSAVSSDPFRYDCPRYFRFRKASGTVYFDFSPDGISWLNSFSEAVAAFLPSIDRIGLGVNPFGGGDILLGCDFFRVTEP